MEKLNGKCMACCVLTGWSATSVWWRCWSTCGTQPLPSRSLPACPRRRGSRPPHMTPATCPWSRLSTMSVESFSDWVRIPMAFASFQKLICHFWTLKMSTDVFSKFVNFDFACQTGKPWNLSQLLLLFSSLFFHNSDRGSFTAGVEFK